MQYSPKLKKAMEEIKAIVKEHDIGAYVLLHLPGAAEYINAVAPSYSCLFFEGNTLRIKAKLDEDFNGDLEKQKQVLTDSIGLLTLFAEQTGRASISFYNLLDMVKAKLIITKIEGEQGETTDIQQNN